MKQTLVPNKGISTSLLWIMAIISGVTVANLYFNQPVLNMISTELGISSLTANWLPIITQLGYAVGLLFIIPLGDLVQVRKILNRKLHTSCHIASCNRINKQYLYIAFYLIYNRCRVGYASYLYPNGLTILHT